MKSFWNAIRDAQHHAPALVLATLCSIGIAFLWGSNIGALYPVIEMTLKGKSIQSWLEEGIQESSSQVNKIETELRAIDPQGDAVAISKETKRLERLQAEAVQTLEHKRWEIGRAHV